MKNKQLVLSTSSECKARIVWRNPRIIDAKNIPLIHYPNFTICWEATDWLLHLWRKGSKPSTLETYAYKISPFIRHLFKHRQPFNSVDDNFLVDFSIYLIVEENISPNEVGNIIRRVLDLFEWLQNNRRFTNKVFGIDDPDAQIRCQVEKSSNKSARGKRGTRNGLYHESIPARVITQEKCAIVGNAIDAIWDTTDTFKTAFRRERDRTIITLLENTGGRRVELHRITVGDIYHAKETGFLTLKTAKKKIEGAVREIPIDITAIDRVLDFIEHERAQIIKKKIKSGCIKGDSGIVLINAHGSPMSEQTISDEISMLRRISGISDSAHPHLFRHRYTTLLLDHAHQEFNDLGLGNIGDSVVQKIMSMMGWSSNEMVSHYHDIYVGESEGWKNIEKLFLMRLKDENLQRELTLLIRRLETGNELDIDEQEDILLFLLNLVKRTKKQDLRSEDS